MPSQATKHAAPGRRRRTTGKAPTRSDWEAAFQKVEAIPAKASGDTAAEFLPRFVAALREKGYVQGEIVARIMALRLGVTEREIREADKALLGRSRGSRHTPSSPQNGAPGPTPAKAPSEAAQVPPAQPSGARVNGRSTHAGLSGDAGLHRR